MIIWLVGMSASGKTTIGTALFEELKAANPATVLIDGDQVRRVFGHDSPSDYTLTGRRENSDRVQGLCSLLDEQGIDVVCCVLSVFPDALAGNRRNYRDYFEVYVRAPIEVLEARQPADLYGRARRGEERNVVGVDLTFPEPSSPDLIIDNGDPPIPVPDAVGMILRGISARPPAERPLPDRKEVGP